MRPHKDSTVNTRCMTEPVQLTRFTPTIIGKILYSTTSYCQGCWRLQPHASLLAGVVTWLYDDGCERTFPYVACGPCRKIMAEYVSDADVRALLLPPVTERVYECVYGRITIGERQSE